MPDRPCPERATQDPVIALCTSSKRSLGAGNRRHLSEVSTEIAALKARRAKICDLKPAMMQELLPGETRLV